MVVDGVDVVVNVLLDVATGLLLRLCGSRRHGIHGGEDRGHDADLDLVPGSQSL